MNHLIVFFTLFIGVNSWDLESNMNDMLNSVLSSNISRFSNNSQTSLYGDMKDTLDLSNVVLHNINNASENLNYRVDVLFDDIEEKQLINTSSLVLYGIHDVLTFLQNERIIEKSSNLIDSIQENVDDISNLFKKEANNIVSISYILIPFIIICIIFVILQSLIITRMYRKFIGFEKIISVSVEEDENV